MINTCLVCSAEFESIKPAKTCSPKCRVTRSRFGVTNGSNVTLDKPDVTRDVTFRFKTIEYNLNAANADRRPTYTERTAKYWYDVPLGAIPTLEVGWPECPEYMNGRQYFLWWKNNFKLGSGADPFDGPILWNPHKPGIFIV